MKRTRLSLGVILAASFALTNCAVEQTGSNDRFDEGIPYEIRALSSDTKTAVDGMSTKWVAGDAVNLFHAVAGTADYKSDNSFEIAEADLADGRFKGTLSSALDADKSYDWYALYPYSSYVKTPASTSGGYVNIGGKSQTQNGLNSMAHLAAKTCPLYGVALDVPSDAVPSIQMHHLTSIIEINVTNSCGEPLDVTSVSFTGTEDIAGNFYVDFVSNPVGYVGNYASATASLSVTGAETIADGASAKFYIAVKPFTAPAGSTLKIAVNGYEKKLVIPAEKSVTFSAGKIKTLNFNNDKAPVRIESGSYVLAVKDGESYYAMSVANNGTKRRDSVELTDYAGQDSYETPNSDIIWNVESQESGLILSNGEKYLSAGDGAANMVDKKASASLITYNSLPDNTFNLTCSVADAVKYLARNGNNGFAFYAQVTGTNNIMLIPAVFVNVPVITVEEAEMSKIVGGDGGTVEIPYTLANPKEGVSLSAISSQAWAVPTVSDGKVSVDVAANETAEARTATITFSYAGAENVIVVIDQYEAGHILPLYTILDMTTKEVGQSTYKTTTKYGDWTIVNGANNNKSWAYFKMGGSSTTLAVANPCYIYNTVAVSHKVAEVTVHIPAGSLSKTGMSVEEWGVYVFSDSEMSQQIDYVQGGTITKNEGTFKFHPTEGEYWNSGYYYKVSWTLANTTTSNGIVLVDKITLSDTVEQ